MDTHSEAMAPLSQIPDQSFLGLTIVPAPGAMRVEVRRQGDTTWCVLKTDADPDRATALVIHLHTPHEVAAWERLCQDLDAIPGRSAARPSHDLSDAVAMAERGFFADERPDLATDQQIADIESAIDRAIRRIERRLDALETAANRIFTGEALGRFDQAMAKVRAVLHGHVQETAP